MGTLLLLIVVPIIVVNENVKTKEYGRKCVKLLQIEGIFITYSKCLKFTYI